MARSTYPDDGARKLGRVPKNFAHLEVDGPQVVAVYPQENENAWLLGFHATRKDVGLVGAKGFDLRVPRRPSCCRVGSPRDWRYPPDDTPLTRPARAALDSSYARVSPPEGPTRIVPRRSISISYRPNRPPTLLGDKLA